MNTYKTLDEARKEIKGVVTIVKINHKTKGEVYLRIKCGLSVLRNALAKKPMPEIIKIIAEYDLYDKPVNIKKVKKIGRNGIDVPCKYCGSYCYGDCRG